MLEGLGTVNAYVYGDREVERLTLEWSKCMADRGYTYPDPDAARDANLEPRTPAQRGFGRNVAVADLECAESVGRADYIAGRFRYETAQWAELNGEVIRLIAEFRAQQVAWAAETLKES